MLKAKTRMWSASDGTLPAVLCLMRFAFVFTETGLATSANCILHLQCLRDQDRPTVHSDGRAQMVTRPSVAVAQRSPTHAVGSREWLAA